MALRNRELHATNDDDALQWFHGILYKLSPLVHLKMTLMCHPDNKLCQM